MRTYALVIVDINSEQVDRRFTYAVPAWTLRSASA